MQALRRRGTTELTRPDRTGHQGVVAFLAGRISGHATLRYAAAVHRRGSAVAMAVRLHRAAGALQALVAQRAELVTEVAALLDDPP